MTPKTIAVHVDGENAESPEIAYALGLARAFDAHVDGIVVSAEYAMTPIVMADIPVFVLDEQRQRAAEAAKRAAEKFRTAAVEVEHDVSILTQNPDGLGDAFAERTRSADLVVVGQRDPDRGDILASLLIEAALFGSGRPVLIVPYIGSSAEPPPKRPIIAWDGGAPAARAAHDALPLLRGAESVEIVTVDGDTDAQRVENSGMALETALTRHGLKARFHVIPSGGIDAANALLSHASDAGADILVMGGYGHSRLREFVLGGATRELLASMTLPVLMAH